MNKEAMKNTCEEKKNQCPPITVSSWTLGDQCKFEDRVKAAKEAGYDGIGLRAETYVDALNEGLFDADILDILKRYDMKVTEVEYITLWAEDNRSYEQKYKEQLCFHMCELFGVNHINIGLMENYSVEHTAQKLKELCQRAGKYVIGVEPMPYSGIPDVKKGWAVVKESGCDNAKLILDSWHWVRADQETDIKLLEGIPADRIVSIQINDVYERPYAKSILRDESMHDRLAPGTGINATEGFVKMIKEKGIEPACIGVEVISDAILAKGVAEAAKFTYENTEKVLRKAWPEVSLVEK
ncbi:sugar phosphate isomerase/epimerase [Clostridiaceae bacterium UIB06]|uniref:Sugar phosphate isomerase/epimerase n=1 Tax=Clostridium thailandense TaxID=2794346 RepID=A0A949TYM2_9CLOT|nr:sugar phosphate isomerase/epimerase [Clostridium thailandense]MBV7272924.1 sugar phosphate isomerase/epimerase [Clostridium thailandense]MCH5136265.1 sugar phosphate isomerase/epimerase [Clostridiaceae bacterium UIB06]